MFETAADFARAADHIGGIEKTELLTDGPVGVGTRFRETRKMFGREATEEMEVTAFDAPRSYALGCENHGCRYHSVLTFKPNSSGTHVEMSFDCTPLTPVAKVMSVMMKPMMKKMAEICGKDLEDLKRSIEGGGA